MSVVKLNEKRMPDAENFRRRATQLLMLAQKARDGDYIKLAEDITDRATQLFGEAIMLERDSALIAEDPPHALLAHLVGDAFAR
jgi:hypothetical protein